MYAHLMPYPRLRYVPVHVTAEDPLALLPVIAPPELVRVVGTQVDNHLKPEL